MEETRNDFTHYLDGRIEVFYEGKQYDCIEVDFNLARGDTDYCRDETWLVYCPKEGKFFKINEVSYRNGKRYLDIVLHNPGKFNEYVIGVHTGKL